MKVIVFLNDGTEKIEEGTNICFSSKALYILNTYDFSLEKRYDWSAIRGFCVDKEGTKEV